MWYRAQEFAFLLGFQVFLMPLLGAPYLRTSGEMRQVGEDRSKWWEVTSTWTKAVTQGMGSRCQLDWWLIRCGRRESQGSQAVFKVFKWDDVMLMPAISRRGGTRLWWCGKFRFDKAEVQCLRNLQMDIYRMEGTMWDDIDLISSFRGGSGGNFFFPSNKWALTCRIQVLWKWVKRK